MYINKSIENLLSFWLIIMFVLVSSIIVVGGLTRLTDSGLSITEWELFSGFFPPLNQNDWIVYFNLYKQIPEFKLQNYNMTLSEFKVIFWWEWAHRFLGRLIGLGFLIPLIYFSFKIKFTKLLNLYFIFLLICFQGFIGWYMVSSGLIDRVDVSHFRLSVHLLIAFLIISLIYWNYLKINISRNITNKLNSFIPFLFLILIFLQISIGAFVSGMDAGKIYNSWPLMGNSYFPDDNDILNIFKISAFNDPSLVQFMHRMSGYILFLFGIFVWYNARKSGNFKIRQAFNVVILFMFLQMLIGIITVMYSAPWHIAIFHQFGAIVLWYVVMRARFLAAYPPQQSIN